MPEKDHTLGEVVNFSEGFVIPAGHQEQWISLHIYQLTSRSLKFLNYERVDLCNPEAMGNHCSEITWIMQC